MLYTAATMRSAPNEPKEIVGKLDTTAGKKSREILGAIHACSTNVAPVASATAPTAPR